MKNTMQLSSEQLAPKSPPRSWITKLATLPPAAWLFCSVLIFSVAMLLIAPWPVDLKYRAILHGLCAQRPSHSYSFNGVNLPFDARMTGIYGGVLTTLTIVLARGRWRAISAPTPGIIAMLGGFVLLMGADGINSTLEDLGLPFAYAPQNWLRLGTGLLMGIALAILLLYLLNATLWSFVKPVRLIRGWRELTLLVAAASGFGVLVASGWHWLYLPLATALVCGTVSVVLMLSLSLLTLITGRENRAQQATDIAGFATIALLLGYAVMALIAIGRWYLEANLGVVLPG